MNPQGATATHRRWWFLFLAVAGIAAYVSYWHAYAAVAAYRLSVRADNPLSERKLAQTFGRTSRRWARARITEARQSP
jgi:hypothetical protein